jgi:prepilin-type N-terminal cleavage/methylation domain-containing protein
MSTPALRGRDGFSLLEVIVSVSILSVILVALAGLTFHTARRSIQLADAGARQAVLLQEVNRLSAMHVDSLPAHAGCGSVDVGGHVMNRCVTLTDSLGAGVIVGLRITTERDARIDSVSFLRPVLPKGSPLHIPES